MYADTEMTNAEREIREKLERETDTMRRQELFKALWRLAKQAQAADSSAPRTSTIACSIQRPSSSQSTSDESGSLATSC
jgi:hypothetical protein